MLKTRKATSGPLMGETIVEKWYPFAELGLKGKRMARAWWPNKSQRTDEYVAKHSYQFTLEGNIYAAREGTGDQLAEFFPAS